ncbi:MAG: hydrogenase-1 expression HyaE [Gammaproteobacteria bacterium]|nr:hydrogenase-1 expression HyaE [Gammaproteobacteria bacterium]
MPSPLIQILYKELGYPLLTEKNLAEFLKQEGTVVLFCSEDPKRFPEANDVAVVLPELVNVFAGQFVPAVVDRSLEKTMKSRYDILIWPSLVFLRQGKFLGKINKIQDWSDYMERIPEILARDAIHNPGVGIPVVNQPLS